MSQERRCPGTGREVERSRHTYRSDYGALGCYARCPECSRILQAPVTTALADAVERFWHMPDAGRTLEELVREVGLVRGD